MNFHQLFNMSNIGQILDKPLPSLLHQTLKTQRFKGKFGQLNLSLAMWQQWWYKCGSKMADHG
jgi:hypothetical protein